MSKSGIVAAMIEGTEVKGSVCKQLLENLATVATKEVGYRQVHHPWLVHAEAQEQASDESWQEGGLREGGHGEGEASIHSCEGLLCGSIEEEHLSRRRRCSSGHSTREFLERVGVSVCRVHRSLLSAR